MSAEGCKADLSLAANMEALRAAAGEGPARTETLSDCVIAVYTDAAFEEREEAVEKKDRETIRRIDEETVCACGFSLSYDVPAREEAVTDNPSGETADEAKPEPGKDGGDKTAEPEKTWEDAADETSESEENSAPDGQDTAASEEPAAKPSENEPAADSGEAAEKDSTAVENEPAASVEEESKKEAETPISNIEEPFQERSFSGEHPVVSQEKAEKASVSENASEEAAEQN